MAGEKGLFRRGTPAQVNDNQFQTPMGKRLRPKYDKLEPSNRLAMVALVLSLSVIAVTCFITHFFNSNSFALKEDETKVRLSYGTVVGKVVTAPNGKKVRQYLGIPYAQPPIGVLRFANPLELKTFPKEPFYAHNFGFSCPQILDKTFDDFKGSDMWNPPNEMHEDCLYLNIWTPLSVSHRNNSLDKFPVMMWIYGGGFYGGSSALKLYDGAVLSSFGNVIVVSFNYRTGALGFFATGDGRLRGNYGMMDQVFALNWIKKNIGHFGGDPNKVTVFGESAGASSIGFHMLSPLSKDLFQRAVLQSGAPASRWSFMTRQQALNRSQAFLEAVNCQASDIAVLVSCLRGLSVENILSHEWVDERFLVFPWVPIIDGTFLTGTPQNLIKQEQLLSVDTILGVNANEGSWFNLYGIPSFSKDNHNSYHNYSIFAQAEEIIDWDLNRTQREQVIKYYSVHEIRDINNNSANRDTLDKVTGDRAMTCPTKQFASEILNSGQTNQYLYYLSYRASNEVWPKWMGTIHGAELQWIFGLPVTRNNGYSTEETNFSMTVMSYFTNFAKYGTPNQDGLTMWPASTPNKSNILEFASPKTFHVRHQFRDNFCNFWNELL